MDKKTYIRPEMAIEELVIETPMLTGSFDIKDEGGIEESLSNGYRPGRRGEWGNLWAQGEE